MPSSDGSVEAYQHLSRWIDEAGYGQTTDYNGCRQEGFSFMPMTVFHTGDRKGERCSTAAAYLEPAMAKHPNLLTLVSDVSARRVVWAEDDGGMAKPRAVGVECSTTSGEIVTFAAAKEV